MTNSINVKESSAKHLSDNIRTLHITTHSFCLRTKMAVIGHVTSPQFPQLRGREECSLASCSIAVASSTLPAGHRRGYSKTQSGRSAILLTTKGAFHSKQWRREGGQSALGSTVQWAAFWGAKIWNSEIGRFWWIGICIADRQWYSTPPKTL